jgi:hypothetical protein
MTPEKIVLDLYPFDDLCTAHERRLQRAAWLSRQAEVDELKRQVEEAETQSEEYRVAHEYSFNAYQDLADKYIKLEYLCAAKEKECEERVKRAHDAGFVECSRILHAAHDAEMCAFAEWVGDKYWYSKERNDWYDSFDDDFVTTTTELLKQFRDDK